jgi:phosphoribosyl-ATP pyrophosphohydrolase
MSDVLKQLMETICDRVERRPPGSYTTKLLDGGVPAIGAKIREEADEVIEAAEEPGPEGRKHFVYEAADVIYHLFVLLGHNGVPLEEVEQELARRFGLSGLEEKAQRSQNPES